MDVEVALVHINAAAEAAFAGDTAIRAIIDAQNRVADGAGTVRFDLKPNKVFLFDRDSEARIRFEVV